MERVLVTVNVPTMTRQLHVLSVELVLDQHVPLLQTFYQPLVVGDEQLNVLPIEVGLHLQAVSLNAPLLITLNRVNYKEAYPLLLFFVHRPQPHRYRRRMPHRPHRRRHRQIETLHPIQDPRPDESHKLLLVRGQVPPSEQPFNHPINRKRIEQ